MLPQLSAREDNRSKETIAADMHFTCRDGEQYNHNDNT